MKRVILLALLLAGCGLAAGAAPAPPAPVISSEHYRLALDAAVDGPAARVSFVPERSGELGWRLRISRRER